MTKLNTLLTSTTGFTAVTLTPEIIPPNLEASGIVQSLIQIVIGIITIFKLFKKKTT